MGTSYRIHPKIGVARVGNSGASSTGLAPGTGAPGEFYIGPERTGGMPIECDRFGNPVLVDGRPKHVTKFKDAAGAIKRQAARFKVFAHDDETGEAREVTVGDGVTAIRWTVHIANKKAVWYNFTELLGDLTFGPWNSYENQHVGLRNADKQGEERQKMIIDPGPRSVGAPRERVPFSRYNVPEGYPHASFPPTGLPPNPLISLNSLGDLLMDDEGRLLVLGGYGWAGSQSSITSFAGANGWWDDVSDGYVLATVTLEDSTEIDLEPASVLVGSPKYAPELVNIVTLDDTLYDIAVRFLGYAPEIYDQNGPPPPPGQYDPFAGYDPAYEPNYRRDIEPIIKRPEAYRWVAQVPSMIDFASPRFDTSDPSAGNRARRELYFSYFRVPVPPESYAHIHDVDPDDGNGSEPGDLTKRMAIPWMADFFDCTIQTPNIDNPAVNQSPNDDGVQIPPSYYVYWWPPQSPMQVVTGALEPGNQVLDGYLSNPPTAYPNADDVFQITEAYTITAAGQTMPYSRGITSFNQMVVSWQDLGFVLNKGTRHYRYFVESERNTTFLAQGSALGIK